MSRFFLFELVLAAIVELCKLAPLRIKIVFLLSIIDIKKHLCVKFGAFFKI